MKGMAGLKAAGLVQDTPESAATFLRKNIAALDKAQLGQYLGHGNADEVTSSYSLAIWQSQRKLASSCHCLTWLPGHMSRSDTCVAWVGACGEEYSCINLHV